MELLLLVLSTGSATLKREKYHPESGKRYHRNALLHALLRHFLRDFSFPVRIRMTPRRPFPATDRHCDQLLPAVILRLCISVHISFDLMHTDPLWACVFPVHTCKLH